jgi:hypothetical protein
MNRAFRKIIRMLCEYDCQCWHEVIVVAITISILRRINRGSWLAGVIRATRS